MVHHRSTEMTHAAKQNASNAWRSRLCFAAIFWLAVDNVQAVQTCINVWQTMRYIWPVSL